MAVILNPKAKEIITAAYMSIGDIALSVARNIRNGKDKGSSHKTLLSKGFLLRMMLKIIFNHVEFDASGEIAALYRITPTQLNKMLNCLVKLGDLQDYPAAPTLIFRGRPTLLVGGTPGAKGSPGDAGSDADIDAQSDPDYDNIIVTEVPAVAGVSPKTFLFGYNPYVAPLIDLTIVGTKVYEIGASITSKDFQVKTTKGRADIEEVYVDDGTLDDELQAILNLAVVNGATQPVTNTVSKTAITTDLTVVATVNDGTTVVNDSDSINFYYPYLYGASDTVLTGSNVYSTLTKLVASKSDKTVTLNGTDKYFYFGFIGTYTDVDKIFDGSGFRVEGDWEKVTLNTQASGLTTNWLENFTFYKTKIKTSKVSQSYKFEHA